MFEGHVDHCDPLRVIGWAYDTERSDATVGVELWHDGEMIVEAEAAACRAPEQGDAEPAAG